MLNSNDRLMQELAERKLQELHLRETLEALNRVVGAYTARHGAPPQALDDLVDARMLNQVPVDPLGGRFLLDSEGNAQNTTLLDGDLARRQSRLGEAIRAFHQTEGRWPDSLDELVEHGLMTRIPRHPYEGRDWHYEPATGALE
jgi:hypothetical protein